MRGISAVVAEVLLISLVIAMSLVALNFVMSVNSSTQASTENLAMSKGVGGSFITVDSVYCTDGNVLHIMLRNIGGESVRGVFSVHIDAPSGTVLYSTTASSTVPARGTNTIELNVPILENCTVPGYPQVTIAVGTPGGTIVTWNGSVGAASVSVGAESVSNTANLLSCSTVFDDPSVSSCYRRLVTVKNNTSSDLNDYTVMVDLDTNTLIQLGKLQPDCNDIRFVLLDGTELNYWVENCGDTNTDVWVKIPLIPASGDVNLYLYYGDANAVDGASTMNTIFECNSLYATSVLAAGTENPSTQSWTNPNDVLGPEDSNAAYFNIYNGYDDSGWINVAFGNVKIIPKECNIIVYNLNGAGGNYPRDVIKISADASTWITVAPWITPPGYPGATPSEYPTYRGITTVFLEDNTTTISFFKYVQVFFTAGGYGSQPSPSNYYIGSVTITGCYAKYVTPEPTVTLGAEEQVP